MPRERSLPPASAASERAGAGQRDDRALVRDFDALYARYGKQIYNTIYQWIGDYEEAADLTQETFLSAHKAREQFRGDSKVYTWLYRIAHNHFKNRLKQRGRQREMEGPSLRRRAWAMVRTSRRTPERARSPIGASRRSKV